MFRLVISMRQKHRDWPSASTVGNGSPRSCISYFHRHGLVIAPVLKGFLGQCERQVLPSHFEVGAGLLECRSGAVLMIIRFHAGVKAAGPAPRIAVDRRAGAARDRANLNVVAMHVPGIAAFGGLAAGEGGHGPLIKAGPAPGVQSSGEPAGAGSRRIAFRPRYAQAASLAPRLASLAVRGFHVGRIDRNERQRRTSLFGNFLRERHRGDDLPLISHENLDSEDDRRYRR